MPKSSDPQWNELLMRREPEDPTGFGRWYTWKPGGSSDSSNINGRFFLLGYILDPDPAADLAPVLSVLEVKYEPRLPPRPPRNLRWEQGNDNRIRISWSSDAEEGVSGWWISWGPRPGDYASTDPGTAGEQDLTGLRGNVWVARNPETAGNGKRVEYEWPRDMKNRIIYTSVRAAWERGEPEPDNPGYPGDYRALSEPTGEINFRP
jgi:hypothetical protein